MADMDGAEMEFYDKLIARMIEEGQSGKNIALKVEDITRVLLKAKEIFLSQPSMLELASPIKILGDIHGCALPVPAAHRLCGASIRRWISGPSPVAASAVGLCLHGPRAGVNVAGRAGEGLGD